MNETTLTSAAPDPAWLQQRDPRLRLLAALSFALMVVNLESFEALGAALSAALLAAAGDPRTRGALPRRLAGLQIFLALLVVTLPFSVPGEPWMQIGRLSASREGLDQGLIIALKANAVVVAVLVLAGGMGPVVMGHAMARLRVPPRLVHLLLFTVRYLGVIRDEARRLSRAMRARGFAPGTNRHTWRSLGWLMGMLLVRSLERSRRVAHAMKCRGFRGEFPLLDDIRWQRGDSIAAALFVTALALLPVLDRLP